MYCHNCGRKTPDSAYFCPYCGACTISTSDAFDTPSSDKPKKHIPIALLIGIVLAIGLFCFFAGKLLRADTSRDIAAESVSANGAESIVPEDIDASNNNANIAPADDSSSSEQRIFDYAELFTPEDIAKLEASMRDIIESSGFDIAVLSQDEGIEDTQKYAEKFYTENDLGIGFDSRGVLFFLDIQNDTYYICTAGSMKDVITDERMESLHLTHDIFLKQSGWPDVISLSFIMLESFLNDDGYIDLSSSSNVLDTPLPSPDGNSSEIPDDVFVPSDSDIPGQYYSVVGNYSKALAYDPSEVFDYFDETDINVFFVAYDMGKGSHLEYATHDINNDDVPELLIRYLSGNGHTSQLIDLYSMNGEKMLRTFGLDSFGYRERLHLLEDGMLLTEGSSSAFCCSCELYTLNSDGSITETEAYYFDTRGDEEDYYGDNYVKLSENAYYNILKNFPYTDLDRITWYPI